MNIARPWELKKTETVDVFDAVGSNIRIDSKGENSESFTQDKAEEINDEWISDKTRFAYDGVSNQRLDKFYNRENSNKLSEISDERAEILKAKFLAIKPNEIAGLAGNILDCESIFALVIFKSLM